MRSTVIVIIATVLALCATVADAQGEDEGAQVFQRCAVCHGADGEGDSGPALAGNQNLQDANYVIDTILHGRGAMPAWGTNLSDEQIAAVATHERTSWGNDFGEIGPEQVAARRSQEGSGETAQPAGMQANAIQTAQVDELGTSLVTGDGRILYRFVTEGPEGIPHCYQPCMTRWLPFLSSGELPGVGDGMDASVLATVQREDGSKQVTFKGWPLYGFAGDQNAKNGPSQQDEEGQQSANQPGPESRQSASQQDQEGQQSQQAANGGPSGYEISDLFRPVSPDVEAIAVGGPSADQQNADQQNADQQNADQQNADQQNADQQNADQQNADQQNADQQQNQQSEQAEGQQNQQNAQSENAQTPNQQDQGQQDQDQQQDQQQDQNQQDQNQQDQNQQDQNQQNQNQQDQNQQDQNQQNQHSEGQQQTEQGGISIAVDPPEAVVTVSGPDGFVYLADVSANLTLDALHAGTYLIAATAKGYHMAEQVIEVLPGQTAEVSLSLQSTGAQQNQQEAGPQNQNQQQSQDQQSQEQQDQQNGQEQQNQDQSGQNPQGQDQQQAAGQSEDEAQGQQASADGQQVFSQNCAQCHGAEGEGGAGPALAGDQALQDARMMITQIVNGGGGMPAFGGQLSPEQIAAVATFERNSWGNEFGEISPDQVTQNQGGG